MFLPLIPLVLEYMFTDSISDETVTLAASMYAILIGLSSKFKLMLGSSLVVRLMFTAVYGAVTVQQHQRAVAIEKGTFTNTTSSDPSDHHSAHIDSEPRLAKHYRDISLWAILMIFLVHAGERFNCHVLNSEPFWELT